LIDDVELLKKELLKNPTAGVDLGNNTRKVGCEKYGFYFSKTRSQNVAGTNPYFQRAPLIEKQTQSSFPLIFGE